MDGASTHAGHSLHANAGPRLPTSQCACALWCALPTAFVSNPPSNLHTISHHQGTLHMKQVLLPTVTVTVAVATRGYQVKDVSVHSGPLGGTTSQYTSG